MNKEKEEVKFILNFLRTDGTVFLTDIQKIEEYIDQLEQEKESTYWKGYIKKQQEALEICKMCKYRKQYFEKKVEEK